MLIDRYAFVAAHQSTLSYDPCRTQDCDSQLLFPVLSMPEAEQSWQPAVSSGDTMDNSVQVWTVAAATASHGAGDLWPVPVKTAVNINNNDNDDNRLNSDDASTNSALAADINYGYDDDVFTAQLQYQHGDNRRPDPHSQTVNSTTDLLPDSGFTGKFRIFPRDVIAQRRTCSGNFDVCLYNTVLNWLNILSNLSHGSSAIFLAFSD